MKKITLILLAFTCSNLIAQINQNINKTNVKVSNAISDIDSVIFNSTGTQMQVLLKNKNVVPHNVSDIQNVSFTGMAPNAICSVYGIVRDETGKAVVGATVTGGTKTTKTDSMGVFILDSIPTNIGLGYVKVEKTGYFPGSRTFLPQTGGTRVNIRMLAKANAGSFNSASGGTITSQGVKVTFSANSITRNNLPYSGMVQVAIQNISPEDAQFAQEMPGDLLALQGTELRGLTSYGMVGVELSDGAGQKLELASGKTASLRFPIGTTLSATAPATIDLWSFDEQLGLWKQEGTATRQTAEYVATVGHFSFWNCDVPSEMIKLEGKVLDATTKEPIQGARVRVRHSTLGEREGYTNTQGVFSGFVPKNAGLNLKIEANCNGTMTEMYNANVGPFAGETIQPSISVSQSGTIIIGTIMDCNGQPLPKSYVVASGEPYFCQNAQFRFSASCGSSSIKLIPFRQSPWEVGIGKTVTLSGGVKNVGKLTVCIGPVTDNSGNTYKTVIIDTQQWMAENLRTTKYNDGTSIPLVSDATQWANGSRTPKMCWYNNDQTTYTANKFGALYNWYAINPTTNGNKNVCPTGWHVPTDAEWNILIGYLDPIYNPSVDGIQSKTAGGKMKTIGTQYWLSTSTGATNESGFSGLPGGLRYVDGTFQTIGYRGGWWSSSESSTSTPFGSMEGTAYIRALYDNRDFACRYVSTGKSYGYSVRCLRD